MMLRLENINKRFGQFALSDINLNIREGEYYVRTQEVYGLMMRILRTERFRNEIPALCFRIMQYFLI